ncbi:biopolymer transporter ExbD [Planctomycetes bacterium K23_9]|uniref:Biopolymer transport protein ExbD/TolR n=1 Tax=Stieleria marina TaxID=1930275 RepID=A0A517NNM1_9BACT|nr:Biopolymer transport protein ExbD/TolR [Planctomycetes bacterium K23_9]
MSIQITCLQCGATHKVNDRLAGRRVRCPGCDTAVHVPELPEPDLSPPEVSEAEVVEPQSVEPEAVEGVAAELGDDMTAPLAATVAVGNVAASDVPSPATLAESFDDDDDDAMPRSKGDEDELDMTPMVDVTFLLLIFFVVTASFQLQKSIMMPRQQTDAPSTSAVEEDPEELDQVELQIDERGAFLVLAADWEAETPGKQNLITKLKEANPGEVGAKLIIKVHEQCKLQALVDGMDAGTIAGYEELQVTQVEEFD